MFVNTSHKITLRQKLVAVVVTSMLLSLVIAITIVTLYLRQAIHDELSDQMTTLAEITSLRSTAALAFKDEKAMSSNLKALLLQPSIDIACAYTPDNKLFSSARQDHIKNSCPDTNNSPTGIIKKPEHIYVTQTVAIKKRNVGSIIIIANLERVSSQTSQLITVSIISILLSLLLVYFIAIRLTKWVAKPITKLAETANKIKTDADYSIRATVTSNDETGELIDNFNDMITTIEIAQERMTSLVRELEERAILNEAQAEKMSERHDSIRDFFSGVTHDLRQPLQAIDMYAEVLRKAESLEESEETKTKLSQAVSNLRGLFGELLDVARFEAQVENLTSLEPVLLSQIVRNISNEFEIVAEQKELRLSVRTCECVALTEPAMLERILRNLVSNAIRYTDNGGILISVRQRSDNIWLEVWDSGRGIPENKLDKIFRQFNQVLDSDSEKGHGLGLSIVHRLALALGHSIHVKSIEGKGTLFRLSLQPDNKSTNINKKVSNQLEMISTDLSVIVIDDDPNILDAITTLLESWEMSVIGFDNPKDALQWADSTPNIPSLIICDYDLGCGETGTKLIANLHKSLGSNVPSLIVSGTFDPEHIIEIKKSEYMILSKPIKPAKLRSMINYLVLQE